MSRFRVRFGLPAAVLAVIVGVASAQDPAKPMRIGVLLSGSSTQWSTFDDALVEGLRQRGYVEGRNLVIVRRYGELSGDRIKSSATDLAGMQLDSIVTSCTGTTRAAASAAPKTPVIMASLSDPVAAGLVKSLAHPGGNVTGRASYSLPLTGKRLSLLREVLPASARNNAKIAVMMNSTEPSHREGLEAAVKDGKMLNLDVVPVDTSRGMDAALDMLAESGVQGLLLFSDEPAIIENRARIAQAAIRLKIPSISSPKIYADAGGLMTYGMDMRDDYKLSAAYVVKVAAGSKPADLPIELPTTTELTINLKTAAAIGITIPRDLRLQAHNVIE
jgi:putative ABC transport system substrate-binding protein